MIQMKKVTKSYQIGSNIINVLKGINLCIHKSDYVSVVGPSGSGKSTLLHTIGGLEPISDGEIVVNGQRVHNMNDKQLATLRKHTVGYVFQQFQLLSTATALENVMMPLLTLFSKKHIRERAEHALEKAGLKHRMHHLPSRLSGGEQQRVAIARAIVTQPSIILADEPTGNLDSATGDYVIGLLEKLNEEQGITLVIITHDESIATRAKRKLSMKDGCIEEE